MSKQTKKKIKKLKNLKGGELMAAAGALLATGLTGAGLSTGLTNSNTSDSNTSDSNTSDSNNLGFNNNALTEILGTPIGDLDRITLKKYLIAMQNGMCTKKLEADAKNIVQKNQLPQAIPIGAPSQFYDPTLPMAEPLNTSPVEVAKDAAQGLAVETGATTEEQSGNNDEVNTILNQLANGDKNIQQTLEEIQKIATNAKDMDKALKKAERVVPTFSDRLKSNFSSVYPKQAQKVKEYKESLEKTKSGMINEKKDEVKKQLNIQRQVQGGKKYSKKNKKHFKNITNKKYFKNITNKKRLKKYKKTIKKYKKIENRK